MPLTNGISAPEFSATATDGSTVTLSGLRGQIVVLYFYPKDDTSGCTAQACGFRDNMARISAKGAVVIGVSPDSVRSHVKFTDKFELTFPLLTDEDKSICTAYGVWVEKSMYGRNYMGVERTTYLIDGEGIIRKVFPKVKVPGHVDAVIIALEAIGKAG